MRLRVTVCLCPPTLPSASQDVDAILHEAELQCRLEHSAVVRVWGVAEDTDSSGSSARTGGYYHRLGLVMEEYDHPLTSAFLASLDNSRRLDFVAQLAAGLAYLHANDSGVGVVVHGDLKPDNVLVAPGAAKVAITDFGLARLKVVGAASSAGHTHLRGAGTAYFMAPELFKKIKGKPVHKPSPASDTFAFAVTAWCILTGNASPYPPLDAEGDPISPADEVPEGLRPDQFGALPQGMPTSLAALLQRCWAADPSARPAMAAVHAELEEIVEGGGVHVAPRASAATRALATGSSDPGGAASSFAVTSGSNSSVTLASRGAGAAGLDAGAAGSDFKVRSVWAVRA
jgi:serine/threonine protein kinase